MEQGDREATRTDKINMSESDDTMRYATESREAVNAGDEQDVLIAIMWATPELSAQTRIRGFHHYKD